MTPKRKAVFLDRDGVLVRTEVRDGKPYAALSLRDFHVLPEAPDAAFVAVNRDLSIDVMGELSAIGAITMATTICR